MLSTTVPITIPSVMRRHTLRLAFEASVIRLVLPEEAAEELIEQVAELAFDAVELDGGGPWS